ncbi:MAG: DUF4445 domain-containing protein, partial [Anaerolineae bacterium]
MAEHRVTFTVEGSDTPVTVQAPTGSLLAEAARQAGVELNQPCGGQGRCGRCAVQVTEGTVRRRSTLRLSAEDIAQGFALACQSVVEGNVSVFVPEQQKIERRLTTDRTVAEITVPSGYDPATAQTVRRTHLTLPPPSMDDQRDDWSRLQTALRKQAGIQEVSCSLPFLQKMGGTLREGNWEVTAILDTNPEKESAARLIALDPGHTPEEEPLWGAAIDIGTTTVTLWLVDLHSGTVRAQVAEYNGQIARGEDIISRIIYASKDERSREEMRQRVLETINALLDRACKRIKTSNGLLTPDRIVKATVAGNSTMMHLFLGIPAASIRLTPFITAINHIPPLTGREVGLNIHPEATVDCLPGVASYVGADITAGVLSS